MKDEEFENELVLARFKTPIQLMEVEAEQFPEKKLPLTDSFLLLDEESLTLKVSSSRVPSLSGWLCLLQQLLKLASGGL